MRPTRRGWVLVGAVALAFGMSTAYGPRSLNALVAPGVVAMVAAAWQVYRFSPPTLRREHPERGERGGTARIRLDFSTDTPRSARVVDEVDEGLAAIDDGNVRELSLGETTVAYDVALRARGERTLGPTTVEVRDVLGLMRSTTRYPSTAGVLVHPRVHLLSAPEREALLRLHGGVGDDRQAVDGLRRYRRGDPLRDVHWKSSAKQPDGELVVKKFATEERSRSVLLATVATADGSDATAEADAVAEAAASVAAVLLESGVNVGLATSAGRVAPDDPDGLRALLDHLAVAGAGSPPEHALADADVVVESAGDGVSVTIDGRDHDFSDLVDDRRNDGSDREAATAAEVAA